MSREGASKYRILAHLRGGDVTESSLVAVESAGEGKGTLGVMKRLKLGADAEQYLQDHFADEARLSKRLNHANLAKLLESGQDDDGPVLVYEYLEGVTLARLRSRAVRKGGGVPIPLTVRIIRQIAKGLHYAHELKDENGKPLKVVHRDVSPDNVMVTYDGEVKLTDFGMATTVATTAKSREERVKGNVAYMAPEQARAEFALDPRADIFALGVIMWELLTGKRLWEGLSEVDVLARLGEDKELPTAKSVVSTIPDDVDAICKMALSKVRDERYDSTADMLEQLQKLIQKPEMRSKPEELGAFVTSLFEDERKKMRDLVEEGKGAKADDEKKPLPAVGALPRQQSSPFIDQESDPNLRFGVATAEEEPSKRVVEVIRIEAPPSDRRFVYVVGAIAVVVFGLIAFIAMTAKEEPKVVEKPYVPPVRPTAEPQPSTSAAAEPEEVTIEIRVTPTEAKLFVDGVQKDNPFRTKVAPATFKHQIHAEADGFEPRSTQLVFDKERSVELALTPTTKGGAHPQPPKPPPPPAPAPSPKPPVGVPSDGRQVPPP